LQPSQDAAQPGQLYWLEGFNEFLIQFGLWNPTSYRCPGLAFPLYMIREEPERHLLSLLDFDGEDSLVFMLSHGLADCRQSRG